MICSVWLARLPGSDAHLVGLLSAEELHRRRGFRQVDDRLRFTASAVLLRLMIAEHAGREPADVEIVRTCRDCGRPHGRPEVVGIEPLDVSIAHSGGCVAVAFVEGARVGVDVERVPTEFADVVDGACHPSERAAITNPRDFAAVWTRKEAVLKADGAGLRVPPSDVVVSAPNEPAGLRAFPRAAGVGAVLHDLDVDEQHVGAVAVLGVGSCSFVVHDRSRRLA